MPGAPPGCGPFGDGVNLTGTSPPTGSFGSRYINPATKSYQQDPATHQMAQMPAVRQRVLLALTTLVGSSTALPTFGITYPSKMGTSFEAESQASIRAALKQMTDIERVLRIDSIGVERGAAGRARFTVSYTDITTGQSESVTA